MSVPVAYIAGTFPARSETFVYREVRALRAQRWAVTTVSLNEPSERGLADFADLEANSIHVYGSGVASTARAAFAESLIHPLRTLATKWTALRDALNPGEALPIRARIKLLGQAFMSLGLARRLRRAGVRHVHCHFAHAPTTIGMYAARQLGVPFSFTGHANDLFQRRALLRRKLERAAFVACISEWHRELYRNICPSGAERYHVVRCGVDVDAWSPKNDAGREIPRDKPLQVLTVCRLVEKKGVDTLLKALAKLDRPWRLTVAGDGPDADSLKALANQLEITASVQWLGAVDNDRVRTLFSQADIFALPCRQDSSGDRDGIPVVLIEAMACGVPVVSGDLPAIRELVLHDRTGILVDGTDPAKLATELRALADAPPRRARVGRQARQHVADEFSMSQNIARLSGLMSNFQPENCSGPILFSR